MTHKSRPDLVEKIPSIHKFFFSTGRLQGCSLPSPPKGSMLFLRSHHLYPASAPPPSLPSAGQYECGTDQNHGAVKPTAIPSEGGREMNGVGMRNKYLNEGGGKDFVSPSNLEHPSVGWIPHLFLHVLILEKS